MTSHREVGNKFWANCGVIGGKRLKGRDCRLLMEDGVTVVTPTTLHSLSLFRNRRLTSDKNVGEELEKVAV